MTLVTGYFGFYGGLIVVLFFSLALDCTTLGFNMDFSCGFSDCSDCGSCFDTGGWVLFVSQVDVYADNWHVVGL